jgi:chromosomal replication initiation ATPase DnaA
MAYCPRCTEDEARALYDIVVTAVCTIFEVTRDALEQSRSRGIGGPGFTRQVAMYLLHTQGVPLELTGKVFGGRALSTTIHACHVVEDTRDDPDIDAKILAVEAAIYRRRKAAAQEAKTDEVRCTAT